MTFPDDILIHDTDLTMAYGVSAASFDPTHSWSLYTTRVSDIAMSDYTRMKIEDPVFHEAIAARQISVGAGDIMLATINVRQYQTTNGLVTQTAIKEVLEYRPGAQRLDKQAIWIRPGKGTT